MDWDKFRRDDQSIDLLSAWLSTVVSEMTPHQQDIVEYFLTSIEERQPIKSCQAASLAIAQANVIAMMRNPDFQELL